MREICTEGKIDTRTGNGRERQVRERPRIEIGQREEQREERERNGERKREENGQTRALTSQETVDR